MQLTYLFVALAASFTAVSAAAKDPFPSSVTQEGINNIQSYVGNVINDIVQKKYKQIATDSSSTGRSLNYLSRDVLGNKNCPQASTGHPAKSANDAVADLQHVQIFLSDLSLDLIAENRAQGKKDVCSAVAKFGDIAAYVDKVRTDGK